MHPSTVVLGDIKIHSYRTPLSSSTQQDGTWTDDSMAAAARFSVVAIGPSSLAELLELLGAKRGQQCAATSNPMPCSSSNLKPCSSLSIYRSMSIGRSVNPSVHFYLPIYHPSMYPQKMSWKLALASPAAPHHHPHSLDGAQRLQHTEVLERMRFPDPWGLRNILAREPSALGLVA